MKRFGVSVISALALMLGGMSGSSQAANILYYTDYVVGNDNMQDALMSFSGTHNVTTAFDSTDFQTKISSGTYDLGIFFVQNYGPSSYAGAITALGAFVSGGGRSIYTDWTGDNTYGGLFGASWTGINNDTSFVVTDPQIGFGLTNPISLTNPGWGIYSMGVSGNPMAATFSNGQGAIVIGNSGRSITNGFLNDTFSLQASGKQLYVNEINYLLGPTPTPEPSTLLLLGSGLGGFVFMRRFRKG